MNLNAVSEKLDRLAQKAESHRLLLVLLLSIPLFFFGIKDQMDWSEDWGQYLDQAQDKLQGKIRTDEVNNHLKHNPLFRGSGFSMLLLPLYALFGLYMPPYLLFLTGMLVIATLFFMETAAPAGRKTGQTILLALMVLYNFQVIRHKLMLSPEFAYMAFAFGSLYFFQIKKNYLVSAIFCGAAITIRDIGWALFFALLTALVVEAIKSRPFKTRPFLVVLLIPPLVLFACEWYMFETTVIGRYQWYRPHLVPEVSLHTYIGRFLIYLQNARYLFEQEIWGWFNTAALTVCAVFVPVGFFRSLRSPSATDWYMIFYMGILLLYSYNNDAMRFLIPVFPIVVFYLLQAADWITPKTTLLRHTPEVLLGLLLLSNFKNDVHDIQVEFTDSPRTKTSFEAWDYIKANVPNDAVITFSHPLVLHLYTGHRASTLVIFPNPKGLRNRPYPPEADYILVNKWTGSFYGHLPDYIDLPKDWIVWENDQFQLAKSKRPDAGR